MKKKILSLIKKILISKRIIKKNIKTDDLLKINIFENEKVDSLVLMSIISELESVSKKILILDILSKKKSNC